MDRGTAHSNLEREPRTRTAPSPAAGSLSPLSGSLLSALCCPGVRPSLLSPLCSLVSALCSIPSLITSSVVCLLVLLPFPIQAPGTIRSQISQLLASGASALRFFLSSAIGTPSISRRGALVLEMHVERARRRLRVEQRAARELPSLVRLHPIAPRRARTDRTGCERECAARAPCASGRVRHRCSHKSTAIHPCDHQRRRRRASRCPPGGMARRSCATSSGRADRRDLRVEHRCRRAHGAHTTRMHRRHKRRSHPPLTHTDTLVPDLPPHAHPARSRAWCVSGQGGCACSSSSLS